MTQYFRGSLVQWPRTLVLVFNFCLNSVKQIENSRRDWSVLFVLRNFSGGKLERKIFRHLDWVVDLGAVIGRIRGTRPEKWRQMTRIWPNI